MGKKTSFGEHNQWSVKIAKASDGAKKAGPGVMPPPVIDPDASAARLGFTRLSAAEITAAFEEWLIDDSNAAMADEAGFEFSTVINGASIYTPFAMFLSYEAGVQETERRLHGELPITAFSAMLDKFERLVLLQEAERIKDSEHPTRERLLYAVRWVLGEVGDGAFPIMQRHQDRFRAHVRRLAGL
jgi:hypothetical protein